MIINQTCFRSLLQETIEENPLACRAALSLCHVEFTKEVPTLAVTLGKRSTLKVNLDFVAQYCENENQVKALIVHEFLHILLGHTLKYKECTPMLNVALDAIINSIIHAHFGYEYSRFMEDYYKEAKGPLRLLRLPNKDEWCSWDYQPNNAHASPFARIHTALYRHGQCNALSDDVLEILKTEPIPNNLEELLIGRPSLLGSLHDPESLQGLDIGDFHRLRHAIDAIDLPRTLAGDKLVMKSKTIVGKSPIPSGWRSQTLPILQRLIVPSKNSLNTTSVPVAYYSPVLNTRDRRGAIRSRWNPLIPDMKSETTIRKPQGNVQIYFDVSGSMSAVSNALVGLLCMFSQYIRHPLWAFSTELHPARIVQGKLEALTTGGTKLGCVYSHIRQTKPAKALIITDGFVEAPPSCNQTDHLCQIEAIIPHNGTDSVLVKYGILVSRLSEF